MLAVYFLASTTALFSNQSSLNSVADIASSSIFVAPVEEAPQKVVLDTPFKNHKPKKDWVSEFFSQEDQSSTKPKAEEADNDDAFDYAQAALSWFTNSFLVKDHTEPQADSSHEELTDIEQTVASSLKWLSSTLLAPEHEDQANQMPPLETVPLEIVEEETSVEEELVPSGFSLSKSQKARVVNALEALLADEKAIKVSKKAIKKQVLESTLSQLFETKKEAMKPKRVSKNLPSFLASDNSDDGIDLDDALSNLQKVFSGFLAQDNEAPVAAKKPTAKKSNKIPSFLASSDDAEDTQGGINLDDTLAKIQNIFSGFLAQGDHEDSKPSPKNKAVPMKSNKIPSFLASDDSQDSDGIDLDDALAKIQNAFSGFLAQGDQAPSQAAPKNKVSSKKSIKIPSFLADGSNDSEVGGIDLEDALAKIQKVFSGFLAQDDETPVPKPAVKATPIFQDSEVNVDAGLEKLQSAFSGFLANDPSDSHELEKASKAFQNFMSSVLVDGEKIGKSKIAFKSFLADDDKPTPVASKRSSGVSLEKGSDDMKEAINGLKKLGGFFSTFLAGDDSDREESTYFTQSTNAPDFSELIALAKSFASKFLVSNEPTSKTEEKPTPVPISKQKPVESPVENDAEFSWIAEYAESLIHKTVKALPSFLAKANFEEGQDPWFVESDSSEPVSLKKARSFISAFLA